MKNFFEFVEIRTKVASVIPFIFGSLLAVYFIGDLDVFNLILMLVSLLLVDMGTTGLNHYMDAKKAILKEGYHYEMHNPISRGAYSVNRGKWTLIALFLSAMFVGGLLVYRTDWIVLIIGAASFAVGLGYSLGPVPISRTFLGEAFSGFFMGIFIPFLAYYIHYTGAPLLDLAITEEVLTLQLNWKVLARVVLPSVPLAFYIANIMLANNICDREEDIVNKRYTLPVVIGDAKAKWLLRVNCVLPFAILALGIVFNVIPLSFGLMAACLPFVLKKSKAFVDKASKKDTFVYMVQSFMLLGLTMNLVILLSILLNI